MAFDAYPDLTDLAAVEEDLDRHDARRERAELSEADSRLLDALSRKTAPVVTAVEDQLRPAPAAQDHPLARPVAGSTSLVPVFQEPPD